MSDIPADAATVALVASPAQPANTIIAATAWPTKPATRTDRGTHVLPLLLDDRRARRLPRPVPEISRQGPGPACREMAGAEDGRPLRLARARRDGRAAAQRAGAIWRPGCDLRVRGRRAGGPRKHGAGADDRRLRAQRHRRPLHPQ